MKNEKILYDGIIKLVGAALLGIFFPKMTKLVTTNYYTTIELIASYTFFILVFYIAWQGNNRLIKYARNILKRKYDKYYKTVLILFTISFFYSALVSTVLLSGWKFFSHEPKNDWQPVFNSVLFIVTASLFIASIYENIFLNKERLNSLSTVEQLNVAKAQAELEALKNQIDPHFIFNSLNTLSYLITKDPLSARLYNDTLAKVYRYILSNKERDLVLLKEEIEFISNYFYLIKIRFSDAVNMMIEINDLAAEDFLIPPISMQALVENAIKHNDFNDKIPLGINVSISSNYVIIKNRINPKNYAVPTSGIGLNNLDNRYKLITKRNIVIENNFKMFSVKLPILKF